MHQEAKGYQVVETAEALLKKAKSHWILEGSEIKNPKKDETNIDELLWKLHSDV